MRKILLGTAGIAFAALANVLPAAPASASANWGAIAVSGDGDLGWAWNYDSESAASQAAEAKCGYSDCSTVASFTGCGSVAYSASMNKYTGGYGSTPAEAESSALWYGDSTIVRAAICND
ncbi:DUF4189 domain-containing protein [Nocardia sp. NBC_01327]|uniref:DUF4189 domain-containing protein n=1 Tax=Nocardia sp. NBC_01327 TaxID=2903593 RepID=UPI002E0E98C9|nr:DUF4189 domain-containing protein [Nocardia sp. NBC_01327]